VTAALVATGVVTVCCGVHHPAPGEASVCVCCPECVTNARLSSYLPEIRRVVAGWQRSELVPLLLRLRAAYRRVEHALAVEAMWESERDEIRHVAAATTHAVAEVPVNYWPWSRPWPPVQGVLA
jgi:hypothetical protein